MTLRKFYLGTVGPLLYDDEDPVNDPDGDFAGEGYVAVRTDGSFRASGVDDHPDSLMSRAAVEGEVETLEDYIEDHGSRHAHDGPDPTPIPTKVVTVVTSVDFANETITTEDVTVLDI